MPVRKRIGATHASRRFSDLLALTPARGGARRGVTWGDVLRLFDAGLRPDPGFARDMRRVRRSRPRLPKDALADSS